MTDPLTFLTAALDAAQRDAEAATAGPWEAHPPLDSGDAWEIRAVVTPGREWRWVVGAEGGGGVYDAPDARHIAGNHPQATLRRIAADRKQYAEHLPIPDHGRFSNRYGEDCPDWCEGVCHDQPKVCRTCRDYAGDPIGAPCRTVEIMAEGYGWTEGEGLRHG